MSESNTARMDALKTLIRLAAAGANGETLSAQSIDWPSVMTVAMEQNVVPLAALAVLHAPELECPEELREYLKNAIRAECPENLLRMQRVLYLIRALKAAGIETRVLKGYAVGENYACPEARSSVDTDLLIDIRQEKAALRFFEAQGFRITPRAVTSHHTVCQHRKYGDIELHIAPYDELSREIWFQGMDAAALIQEEPIVFQTPDGEFTGLGYTDHLIYITLHMVKHFIYGGLTLRMMLDIARLFAQNKEKIDAARFWDTMERLRYSQLANCVFWMMILYGGFQAADFPGCAAEAPEGISLILEDMLQGGYMGVKEEDARRSGGMEYNRQVMLKSKSVMEYRLYMLRFKLRGAASRIFPNRKMLSELFPRASRHTALIPFLFVYQMLSYPVKKLCEGVLSRDIRSDSSALNQESQVRMDMFRKLGML